MPRATITMIYCVHEATGTDLSVNQAIAGLPERLPREFDVLGLFGVITALPGVISAIDTARADPDNLYVTTSTEGGIANSIWPESGSTRDMQAGQSNHLGIVVDFVGSQNISLWDWDEFSGDDLLGSVTILETDLGQGEIAKLAKSLVEQSYYYVLYRVD